MKYPCCGCHCGRGCLFGGDTGSANLGHTEPCPAPAPLPKARGLTERMRIGPRTEAHRLADQGRTNLEN